MSEYYEFLALDRPLSTAEQAAVRALSTRARITATSFTNTHHWGNFRGNPRELVEKYYDAHLYITDWGTHEVMLPPNNFSTHSSCDRTASTNTPKPGPPAPI